MSAERIKPIRPEEALEKKVSLMPDAVLEAFNELIAQNMDRRGSSTISQKEILAALKKKGLSEKDIFANHWLDVEDIYRAAGWQVKYESSSYDESYYAYYIFTAQIC